MSELKNFDQVPADYVPGNGELRAVFHTSMGTFEAKLLEEESPQAVANFVGLATGKRAWKDPKTGAESHGPFYDGVIFHRVIPEFMIQCGDRLGTGTGGPGYRFKDEFNPKLRHNRGGLLSMANAGPNTNGSQFFVTEVPTPWLDGKHMVFGQLVAGEELVGKIARVPAGAGNKPRTDVVLERLEIKRV